MDLNKWKGLLLEWLRRTELDGLTTAESIEETDLSSFFANYKRILGLDESWDVHYFIQSNYPDFDGTAVVLDTPPSPTEDYVFVYTLLLHYGCVVCCNSDLQTACQQLDNCQQLAITVLLEHLVNGQLSVTRENLSNGIVKAQQKLANTKDVTAIQNAGDPTANLNPQNNVHMAESHCKQRSLKSGIHVEPFESIYLIDIMKAKEAEIEALKQVQLSQVSEINDLKMRALYTVSEAEENSDELCRKERLELRTLRKNNTLLEDKVEKLLIDLDHVICDKASMMSRLKSMGKDLKMYKERTAELAQLVDDYNADVLEKNKQISELVDTNMELEAFISENRSLLNRNLESSQSSQSSFANASYSNVMATNLGSCIIDIQLKEKELENMKLIEELKALKESQVAIRESLRVFLEETSEIVSLLKLSQPQDILSDARQVADLFRSMSGIVLEKSKLNAVVQAQKTALIRCKDDRDKLTDVLTAQTRRVEHMQSELDELRTTIKCYADSEKQNLESVKYEVRQQQELIAVLKLEKESFRHSIKKAEEDALSRMRKILKLNLSVEKLKFEKQKLETKLKETELNGAKLFTMKLDDAQKELQDVKQQLNERDQLVDALQKKNQVLDSRLRDSEQNSQNQVKINEGLLVKEKETWQRERSQMEQRHQMEKDAIEAAIKSKEHELDQVKTANREMEAKLDVVCNNLRPSVTAEEHMKLKMLQFNSDPRDGQCSNDEGLSEATKNHCTSTPRLSMKQKVQLHNELLRKRRISFLTTGIASSDTDDAEHGKSGKSTPTVTMTTTACTRHKPSKVVRSVMNRNMINRMQKMRRQSTFNRGRETLKFIETNQSVAWEDKYDFMNPQPTKKVSPHQNTKTECDNFEELASTRPCDVAELFPDKEERHQEKAKQDSAGNDPMQATASLQVSGHRVNVSMSGKTHSIDSGLYLINDTIPQTSVLQLEARPSRTLEVKRNGEVVSGGGNSIANDLHINVGSMPNQMLLQVIAIVLIAILVCVVYQNIHFV